MAVSSRIRALRLMEKMEKAHQHGNSSVNKTADGTLQYIDNDGSVLFEARMITKTES